MFRFIFLLSILTAINAIAQETEIKNWIQYFDKHQKEKTPISKSYYAKEDFTVPDTSHILRDVLFLGRIYVGTYGQEYNRMLAFFQATKKINDSIYSFKAFFKQRSR